MLQTKRIYLPKPNNNNEYVTYENQLQPRYIFDDKKLENIYHAHEDEIMKIVEKEITDYVNCEDLCSDEEGMFPQPKFMTGEWYLREVSFKDDYLSIPVTFLGTDLGYPDDYLGLEATFTYHAENNQFSFDGINSESL